MITAKLAYVALVVSDVEAAATVLQRDFGLQRTDCAIGTTQRWAPVFGVGASALALFAPGDPLRNAWGFHWKARRPIAKCR